VICLDQPRPTRGQGRNEREQGGRNSPGAESIRGDESLRGRRKVPKCHK